MDGNLDLIQVTQLPVIEERLRAFKKEVCVKVAEAKSLACTPETVPAVKNVRSDLRKWLGALEAQRIEAKKQIMQPYTEFEAIYKECVTNPLSEADADLCAKIKDTEDGIKAGCEAGLRDYFTELCAAEHVEWLTYERAGIVVDMTSAKQKVPKKLREKITHFVTGVSRGVSLIADMDNAEEIMVEFKRTLDAAEAISIVQERHRRVEREKEALASRVSSNAVPVDFIPTVPGTGAVSASGSFSAPEVLPAPVDETPPEPASLVYVSFKVTGTIQQIKELKKFLTDGGYQIEQLGD